MAKEMLRSCAYSLHHSLLRVSSTLGGKPQLSPSTCIPCAWAMRIAKLDVSQASVFRPKNTFCHVVSPISYPDTHWLCSSTYQIPAHKDAGSDKVGALARECWCEHNCFPSCPEILHRSFL